MQSKWMLFIVVCFLVAFACSSAGCSWKKELILEHSTEQSGSLNVASAQAEVLSEPDKAEVADTQIYVHVCGQVKNPDVYQTEADARVFQVIQLAGGFTAEADEAAINQAQSVYDGQMIYVPRIGESADASLAEQLSGQSGYADNEKVNINTADVEALMSLPGIGEGKAQSILQYRQEHGYFQSIEDIMNVDGIKEGTYTKFKDKITV